MLELGASGIVGFLCGQRRIALRLSLKQLPLSPKFPAIFIVGFPRMTCLQMEEFEKNIIDRLLRNIRVAINDIRHGR